MAKAKETKSTKRITPETVEKVNTKATEKNVAKVHAEATNSPTPEMEYEEINFISDGTESGKKLVAELNKLPKMLYFIPLKSGEKEGDYFPFTINGCKCYIPMGRMVYIPANVAQEIETAKVVTGQAGKDVEVTDDKPKGKNLGVFKKLN